MVQRISSKDADESTESTGANRGALDDDFEDEEDSDESEASEEYDDDESEEDEDESEKGDKPKGDPRIQRLTREAARHRMRAKTLRKKVETLETELQELRENGVSGDEGKRIKAESEKLRKDNESLAEQVKLLKVGAAIRDGMAELKLNPKRAKAITKVLDLDDVDVDEDGEVSGVIEALEAIAQDYPEWVIQSQGDDDDSRANGNGRTSGQSSRKPGRKKPAGVDKSKLFQQYPALARGYSG